MDAIGPIFLGVLALIISAVFKALLDWEAVRPGAPRASRETTLFRLSYFAPDFVLLSIGLLLSAQALRPDLLQLFPYLLSWYVACLLITILLWLCAGPAKRIPLGQKTRTRFENGQPVPYTVVAPMWVAGLTTREGLMTLIVGNLLGLSCPILFAICVLKS